MAIQEDGFSTLIAFGQGAAVFVAKTVTPPGIQLGGANDISGMENTLYRTKASKKLIDLTDIQSTGYYDSSVLSSFIALLGVNVAITLTFPDASTLAVYGFLDSFVPGSSEEGSAPEGTVTIVVSNRDNATPPAESAPVYTP